jgi:hypothetical protein
MTLTEEQRGTVAFDPEKARASIAHYRIENPSNVDTESALKELVDQANLAEDAIAEIERLRADLEQSERVIEARLDVIDQQAARIKELEADNQNLVTLNKSLMNNDWILRDNNRKYRKRSQKAELLNKSLKSKIGPDARPPCWQITEERVGLLRYCLDTLLDAPDIEESPGPRHSIEMLRAMLTEAE